MAGLRDAGTMKLFGPSKKRSQSSEKGVDIVEVAGDTPVADEDKSALGIDQVSVTTTLWTECFKKARSFVFVIAQTV